jgi:hypothetical protein
MSAYSTRPEGGWRKFLQTADDRDLWQARYALYLLSLEWSERRSGALRRARYKCEKCGDSTGLQVHHVRYTNVGEERVDDLRAVCGSCHKAIHESGEKFIPPSQATIDASRKKIGKKRRKMEGYRAAKEKPTPPASRHPNGTARCQALTKKGIQCPIYDATIDPATGAFACHVHNSVGMFRKQVETTRAERKGRQPRKPRLRTPHPRTVRKELPETPPLKDTHKG